MSLRYEQHRSLRETRDFLRFIRTDTTKWDKAMLREKASLCLHHFPMLNEKGKPWFTSDPFTTEEGGPK